MSEEEKKREAIAKLIEKECPWRVVYEPPHYIGKDGTVSTVTLARFAPPKDEEEQE